MITQMKTENADSVGKPSAQMQKQKNEKSKLSMSRTLEPVSYTHLDLFVDESVDTAEQAIQNLLLEDLHQALLKLSPAERDFILSYYCLLYTSRCV